MKNKKAAGISLVALVITIIVLIILTGAVIVTFMEGGIIDRAKESVFKNDMRTYQEILALKRAENQMEIALGEKEDIEINASTLEEIQEIIPEFKEEYEGIVVITNGELSIGERVSGEELSGSEELYLTWLSDLGIGLSRLPKNAIALVEGLEVGDYVAYTPDGNNVTSYELLYEDSGYYVDANSNYDYDEGEETDQTIIRQDINWRVLKNDGRNVTLISETPINSIGLGHKEGFLNGPYILDNIYNNFYSSSKTIEARNLKVEDVNETIGVKIGEVIKSYYYDTKGNDTEFDKVATFGDAIDKDGYDVSVWSMPDDNYREYELYYMYTGLIFKPAANEKAYNMIFKDVANINNYASGYWLSSSCVYVNFRIDNAEFDVRSVVHETVDVASMYDSDCYIYSYAYCGRPVVVLNSDVQVANPSAGGDTLETAWELK